MNDTLAADLHARFLAAPATDVPAQLHRLSGEMAPLLADHRRAELIDAVVARIDGLGVLSPLLADPAVTDVMITGGRAVWVERHGVLEQVPVAIDPAETERLIGRIVAPLGLRIDRSCPMVDARLPDGTRAHAVIPPLAIDGPCLTLRRFSDRRLPLSAFASDPVVDLLGSLVRDRANVLVVGATGAGKTTLINALAGAIAPNDRVVTIEDTAELRLDLPHVVRLEARPASADGLGAVTIRDLVRTALRMRPDRLVVGEVRGAEAFDLVQALHTGHRGSLATCHANGPADSLVRLATLAHMAATGLPAAVMDELVTTAIDVVVAVERAAGGARRIRAVACPTASGSLRMMADGDEVMSWR